jgi:hypothetical protein
VRTGFYLWPGRPAQAAGAKTSFVKFLRRGPVVGHSAPTSVAFRLVGPGFRLLGLRGLAFVIARLGLAHHEYPYR